MPTDTNLSTLTPSNLFTLHLNLNALDGPTAWQRCQDVAWMVNLIEAQTWQHGLLPGMHWRFAELVRVLAAATCRTAGLSNVATMFSALDPIRDGATAQQVQAVTRRVWETTCTYAGQSRNEQHRHAAALSAAGTAQALLFGLPAAMISDARVTDSDPATASRVARAAARRTQGTEDIDPNDPDAAAYIVAEAVYMAATSAASLIRSASVCDILRAHIAYTDLPPALLPRPQVYATFDAYVADFPAGERYRGWLSQYPGVRLIHGIGPHGGLPGDYLWAAVLGKNVVVNDCDDGMIEKECGSIEEAERELDLLGQLAPFALFELEAFGYHW